MSKQEIMCVHVQDWQASGLTQQYYCEQQDLKLPTFGYWIRKYTRESNQTDIGGFISISKQAVVAN